MFNSLNKSSLGKIVKRLQIIKFISNKIQSRDVFSFEGIIERVITRKFTVDNGQRIKKVLSYT
jgi:hypothetical protein